MSVRLNLLPQPKPGWHPELQFSKHARCAHCRHLLWGNGCDEWEFAHGECFLLGLEDAPQPLLHDGKWFCWEGCRAARDGHRRAAMRVYFIQQGDDGPIKIGIASNVKKRRSSLQVGSSVPLWLHGSISGDATVERALHEMFAADRIHGEWFKPSARLLEIITAMAEDGDDDEEAA